jgi:hypothetical protein
LPGGGSSEAVLAAPQHGSVLEERLTTARGGLQHLPVQEQQRVHRFRVGRRCQRRGQEGYQVRRVRIGAMHQELGVAPGAPTRIHGLEAGDDLLQHVRIALPLRAPCHAFETFGGLGPAGGIVARHAHVGLRALAKLARVQGGGPELGVPHGVGAGPRRLLVLGHRLVVAGLTVGSVAQPLVVAGAAAGGDEGRQSEPRDPRGSPPSHSPLRPNIAR